MSAKLEFVLDQWDLKIRIKQTCPYESSVYCFHELGFFEFYENESNLTNLEESIKGIIKTVRDLQAEENRVRELRKTALEKLTSEERKVLGL